jgi:hypothetical protein
VGIADTTPIRTPVPLTSSYATSPEYSVDDTVRSAKKYRTLPGPNTDPAGSTRNGTASPCRCSRSSVVESPRRLVGNRASYRTACRPRLVVCSCARTSRSCPFRGSARPPLPVRISPSATPANDSFTRTRPARTSSFRPPDNRTGTISTTALFLSPWNAVPARRATSEGTSPRERNRDGSERRVGRTVPSRPTAISA